MSFHAVQQAIHAMWYHAEQIDIPTAPVEEEIADSRPTSSVERGRKRGRVAARMERKTALRQAKAQKRAERLFKKYGHGEITKETMARNETAAHLVETSEPHDPSCQPASEPSSKSTVKDQAHASPYSPEFEARLTQDPANAAAIAALQANIEAISGYTFTDPSYFTAALTRIPQTVGNTTYHKLRHQLAFIGDTVLRTQYYPSIFPIADEDISALPIFTSHHQHTDTSCAANVTQHAKAQFKKTSCFSNKALAQQAIRLGLRSHPELAESPDKSLSTRMKALIGAVHLDSGEDHAVTRNAITALLDSRPGG